MSTAVTDNVQDRQVMNSIVQSGFRPQLFLVAAGSYASGPSYGSGAASTGNYDSQTPPVTIRNSSSSILQTRAHIRQQDNNINFDITLTLDATQANPFGGQNTDEVRIRVLPLSTGESTRYNNPLKVNDPLYGLPLFLNVEIVNQAGVDQLPSAVNTVLQARLLLGGELALVQQNQTAAPPTTAALTAAQLGARLGGVGGTELRIHVRGEYKGALSV